MWTTRSRSSRRPAQPIEQGPGHVRADRRRGRGIGRPPSSPACRCRGASPPAGCTAGRSPRRPPPASCGPTGPRRSILFCGMPRCAASSGENGAMRPRSASARRPIDGVGAASSAASSAAMRSPDRCRDELGSRLDAGQGRGLDREVERRRQAHGPEHPERVLLEPDERIPDRAQDPRRQRPPRHRAGRRRPAPRPGRRPCRPAPPTPSH